MKHPISRTIASFAVLLVVFLVIAIPFKVLVVIPGFTDVRPVSMLVPVYGIFFGIPGCLAFAVGNLIVDIISGDLRMSSIAGFVGSFVYPYLMYLIWTQLRKREFNLRSGRMVAAFCASTFACACLQALIIAPAVEYHYPEVNSTLFALTVAANGTVFPIVLAIPFIILIQEEMGLSPLSSRSSTRRRKRIKHRQIDSEAGQKQLED